MNKKIIEIMYPKYIKKHYKKKTNILNFALKQSMIFCSIKQKKLNQKMFDFLQKPVITDKATKLIEQKQYTFDVDSQLTKKQIREIFESYYKIKIQSIRTHRISRKKKRSHKFKPIKRVILVFTQKKEISIFQNLVQEDKLFEL